MDAQNQTGLVSDCVRIIGNHRLVGCPDLAQSCAAGFEHFPDPKTAADLHQFTARNDDFRPPFTEMMRNQEERRGTIIYDRSGFAPAGEGEAVFKISAAGAAPAADEIEFQIAVAGGNFRDPPSGLQTNRCAAEIGVQDDAGPIDYRLEPRTPDLTEFSVKITQDLIERRNVFTPTE